ncbi:hypothetical protein AB0B85_20040 [Micromonospora sp. NPDC049044]|uniref:hypothetical protein n=1 Tax=unclassified Micromonospora TaxID=2617518 RepID=UPI0033F61EB8
MSYHLERVDLPEPAATARSRFEACLDLAEPCAHTPPCGGSEYESLMAPFQFHLNIAGMAFCRDGMRRTGMTYQATSQPFPAWPFKDMDDWQSADQGRRDAYNEAERAAAAQTVPGMVGIPEFKLMSNGPWLVGAQEIEQALYRYQASSPHLRAELEGDDLWVTWLGWLNETISHGGFTVG